jgi:predicted esterase
LEAFTMRIVSLLLISLIITAGLTLGQTGTSKPGSTPPRPRRIYYGPDAPQGTINPLIVAGNNPRVRVRYATRLELDFVLPNAPARFAQLQDATQTIYQLWVPTNYRHSVPIPLLLFVSAKPIPDEYLAWGNLCRKYNVMFAMAYQGGDEVPAAARMQQTLDVLDDIRRRMAVDTDRVYLGGFSEGARTACDLAYAYPELLGGVIAIGGASSLRSEPWLRQRVKDRLSVALVVGQNDTLRGEMETIRLPVLRDLEVRTQLWSVPSLGHAMPTPAVLEEVLIWLEARYAARKALAVTQPSLRMPEGVVPMAELYAKAVAEDASARMKDVNTRSQAALQLEGVTRRWPGSEAAKAAQRLLERHDERAKEGWQVVYDRRQQEFFHLEAKALDKYLSGTLPPRDAARKKEWLAVSRKLWEQVKKYGGETPVGKEAERRVEELGRLLGK